MYSYRVAQGSLISFDVAQQSIALPRIDVNTKKTVESVLRTEKVKKRVLQQQTVKKKTQGETP